MGDYPDPDEEYELMYGDDLDVLREHDEPDHRPEPENIAKSRRSLDFSSPAIRKTFGNSASEFTPFSNVNTKDSLANACGKQQDESGILSLETSGLEASGLDISGLGTSDLDATITEPATLEVNGLEGVGGQKRTLEDLFGDIDDLEEDALYQESKRHRGEEITEEQRDRELMEKIVEMRRLRRLEGLGAPLRSVLPVPALITTQNLSFDVPRWPFLPLTRSDGEKVYVRMHNEEFMDRDIDELTNCNKGYKNLLGNSFKDIWEEAKAYLESKTHPLVTALEDIENVAVGDVEGELWVQRYRPRSYCELLSDEATNRTLLHWIKLWDKLVFNREVKLRRPEVKSSFNKRSGKFEFGRDRKGEAEAELDDHGRPTRALALLCGPPGCGKTTLAHLLARHAGYNVVEVNASDDRNVESFKASLENSTQMKSVLDAQKRPNCLVLDEIDGAPLPAIEFLVKFMSNAPPAGKGKKGKGHVVRRPVICICNDPYAPSLRPLRQVALVLVVPPAAPVRLGERVSEVALREGLCAPDAPLLQALALRTNNDIRACLTVLHFCKTKGKMLKLADINKINIGLKDMSKSLFEVWKEVFQVQPVPLAEAAREGEEGPAGALRGRARRLMRTVYSAGDYERLSAGVFENYLERSGGNLGGAVQALEWFTATDQLSTQIASTQNYSLYPYLPYAFLCWHFLFARLGWSNIKYPKTGFEMFQKQTTLTGVVLAVQRGVSPQVKPYCSRRSLLLDLLPLLPHIISPALRPVNLQLYTERERLSLASLVGVMLDYNLQYTQQRLPDGNYHYLLDPDIATVGIFDEKTASVRNLTYAMKQMIAREVEQEKIHRLEESSSTLRRPAVRYASAVTTAPIAPSASTKPQDAPQAATSAAAPKVSHEVPVSSLPNHLQRLEPKKLRTDVPLVMKDFFGRTVTCSPATTARKVGKIDDIVKSPVWYHYKEGFNNAVRRDVKISDLL